MTIELCGVTLYYEQCGAGKDILLLHGWGGKCESFAPVIRDFSGRFRITALDFPGQGNRSNDPPEPWSVTEYMEMTAQFIRATGIERCNIIAHSFGGRVALVLAATYPELVGRMILTGVPGLKSEKPSMPTVKSRVYKALKALATSSAIEAVVGEKTANAWHARLQEIFGSADYRALSPEMRKTFSRIVTQDLTEHLTRIKAPTLLFWGANDTAAPIWMAQKMEKMIPDAGLIVKENVGHFAYLDCYSDFQAVIQSFFS